MPLQTQHQNLVMSSFVLWLNNLLLSKGGYYNVGTKFFPSDTIYNGYSSYNAPYKPIIFDSSYSAINQLTGLYINNSFITIGQSGFAGVDTARGAVYFTGSNIPIINTCSGNYAIPEYNVMFPAPDIAMIFEGKMALNNRNKTPLNTPTTGTKSFEVIYPCIFVRTESFANRPWAMGGQDLTTTNISCYILSDNVYSFDALRSILADQKYKYLALLNTGELPTNNINSLRNNRAFNYTGIASLPGRVGSGNALFINDVSTTDFTKRGLFSEVASLPPDVSFGVIDFEINKPRIT